MLFFQEREKVLVCMTGQQDQRVNFLAGEVTILAGHCPLTDCYLETYKFFLITFEYVPHSSDWLIAMKNFAYNKNIALRLFELL